VAADLERRGSPVAAVLMADSSRYLQRIPIPPGEVERMVLDFVESEAIKPFVTTAPLRDKAIRRIHAYYDYIYNTVDSWVVDADIHLIVCEQALTSFQDAEGQVLASNEAWKDATRGRLLRYQGSGTHNEMFNEPALSENAALIRKALYSLDSLKRKGEHAG
jgi:thioesterase domain-containing protein